MLLFIDNYCANSSKYSKNSHLSDDFFSFQKSSSTLRTVSNRLGHAQTSTTLNIYAHALKSRDLIAAQRLDELLNNQ